MAEATRVGGLAATGRAALAHGAWADARAAFDAALEQGESPDLLEGLSWAAWWQDDVTGCIDARERAYRAYRAAGNVRGAARMALWVGDDHLEFRGEAAIANGWWQRAGRLLEGEEPCPEAGWLAAFTALGALGAGDLDAARALGAEARELGASLGVVDLEMFGLATEGLALVNAGLVDDGMRQLDEAAAAALGGEYEQLAPAGWTCCYLIDACERVRDYDRAAQWCRKVEEFSARMSIEFVRGKCRAHYGAVIGWHGDWAAAERELDRALRHLHTTRPSWRREAIVRLGDLRRRQGRLAEAESLYRQAEGHELAALGLAALALERGDAATGRDLVEPMLERIPRTALLKRAGPLELIVAAECELGQPDAAEAHLRELREVATAVPTPVLSATAAHASATVAAATGRHDDARREFGQAAATYHDAEAPFEAARAELALAGSLLALDRPDAAARAADAALSAFAALGAPADESRARALLRRAGAGAQSAESPLTARELQVVDCVARGLSDREIAAELTISDHTVHRHVANIYAKLGCSTRAAAVTAAHRRGLL